MEDVKHVLFYFNLVLLICSCASSQQQRYALNSVPAQTSIQSTNSPANLDKCILEGANYLITRMSTGAKVAVINIDSQLINLSNYVIDNLSMYLVNEDKFIVIERSKIDILQKEQKYQMSGEVSDETAVSIGKQIGAQFIITGAVLPLGDIHSLHLKITNVQTAQIIGTKIYQMSADKTLIALLEPPQTQPAEKKEEPVAQKPQTVIQGDVNIGNL